MGTFPRQGLPPEMVDYMLDEIISEYATISDRRALKNCSLVCKTWLPRSSVHLLRTIEVRTLQLEEYLACARTSPRLRTHVREFIIQGTMDVTIYLEEIFETMPGLTFMEQWNNLTLEFARPPDFIIGGAEDTVANRHFVAPPAGATAARAATTSINHLKLSSTTLVTVALSIRPFRRIGTLELRSVRNHLREHERHGLPNGSPYGRLLPLQPPPEVTTLVTDGCLANDLAFLLATIPLRPTFVCVKQLTQNLRSSLSDFLRDAGHDVEKLTLWPIQSFHRPVPGEPGTPNPLIVPIPKCKRL